MLRKLTALAIALALALPAFAATPVNVNKADAETLAKSLDGIGLSKASAIVAWRDEHGSFKNIDELTQVKGVSAATLERNRSAILLSDDGVAKTDKSSKNKIKAKKAAEE
ncbi:ComEA family DNA-binding protein [Dyella tabacisoli]|uniref:Competence protein ComEA n=1 Tax=Dyella tabacisoli TaxID=2282381 RepID=A0A369UQK2_9GAMM|nr:helix-hairpin-helix domain-containing protein [Dyella tabacisoli]RDD82603.1 competence protein ComEA [Dyella tabacisoli]